MSDLCASPDKANNPTPTSVKLFNWGTYGGIAGLGVFAATLPIAYWAKYGGGAGYFKAAASGLEKLGIGPRISEELLMTTALMQGGNLAVPFVKLAENHKEKIVTGIGNAIGEPIDKKALKKEPEQTWGSLIKARILLAWLPVFVSLRSAGAILGPERFKKFEEGFAEHVICKPLGKPTNIAGQETKLFKYGKIAALDLFATGAAAALLFVGSRFFAREKPHEHKPEPAAIAADSALLPATETNNPATQPALFTDTLRPSTSNMLAKPRADNFAQGVLKQKSLAADAQPGLRT